MDDNKIKVLQEEKTKKSFSLNSNIKKNYWKSLFVKILKLLGKIFAGAIIFSFLGYMAPQLRIQIPSFYKVIDFLLSALEWICSAFPL